MNLRARTTLGALVLYALALSAFGAATAAASGGLTAVECVEFPGGRFESSHCLTNGKEGNFETVAIKPGVKKEVEGTATREVSETQHELGSTANPVAVFHSIVGGIAVTVTCGKANSTGGKVENKVVGTEMVVHGTEAVVTYGECHASKETEPAAICTVQGTAPPTAVGEIKTNKTTGISGPEHSVTVKPEEGEATAFTEFKILASGAPCFTAAALSVKVTGHATGTANTKTHSHLTIKEPWPCGGTGQPACGGLKVNGSKAAQTVTGTGFTKGNKEATVGALTESEILHTEA
jgi:hypothetical protein